MAIRMLFEEICCSVAIQPGQLFIHCGGGMLLAVNWDNMKVLWYKERYDCKTMKSYRELLVHISW
jgi:hypothetical protein